MKAALGVITFVSRHFLFVVFAMVAGCALWTIAYFALLLIAVVTNQGPGGPLAYPAGILAVLVVCVLVGWGIFAPASAVGIIFCRLFRLPRLAAIPVVWLAALWLYSALRGSGPNHSILPDATALQNFGFFLSLPLGIYWWLTEGPGALFDTLHRWLSQRLQKCTLRRKKSAPDT
jgi:hypothetical protein